MKNHPLIVNKGGKGRIGLMRLIKKFPPANLKHKKLHDKLIGLK